MSETKSINYEFILIGLSLASIFLIGIGVALLCKPNYKIIGKLYKQIPEKTSKYRTNKIKETKFKWIKEED